MIAARHILGRAAQHDPCGSIHEALLYFAYLARRFGMMLLVVVLAVTINFVIPRLMPGDPIEQQLNQLASSGAGQIGDVQAIAASYRAKFGLDQPVLVQYWNYWAALLRFDLGVSLAHHPATVAETILAGLPWTLSLLGFTTLVSFAIGTLLGGRMAWPRRSAFIRTVGLPILLVSAVPYFLIGLVLLFVFATVLKLFPAGGGYPFSLSPGFNWETIKGIAYHATLPAASIILAEIGAWAIGMRGMLVSVLGEDYITLAEAKGLPSGASSSGTVCATPCCRSSRPGAHPRPHGLRERSWSRSCSPIRASATNSIRRFRPRTTSSSRGSSAVVVSIAVAMFLMDLIYP
jgi:peptide/nickel transport system permease protein